MEELSIEQQIAAHPAYISKTSDRHGELLKNSPSGTFYLMTDSDENSFLLCYNNGSDTPKGEGFGIELKDGQHKITRLGVYYDSVEDYLQAFQLVKVKLVRTLNDVIATDETLRTRFSEEQSPLIPALIACIEADLHMRKKRFQAAEYELPLDQAIDALEGAISLYDQATISTITTMINSVVDVDVEAQRDEWKVENLQPKRRPTVKLDARYEDLQDSSKLAEHLPAVRQFLLDQRLLTTSSRCVIC